MLNTYIKNVGSTQTIIGNRCQNHVEEMDWNADYDGNKAKIRIRTNSDGNKGRYHFTLDNSDLANLLNVDSINMPIHKRLKADFKKPVFRHDPNIYRIELPPAYEKKILFSEPSYPSISDDSYEELMDSSPTSFLSSPSPDDEFVVPVTMNPRPYKKYTFTPKRRNLTLKRHKTHRIYKKPKSTLSTFKKGGAKSTFKKRWSQK
jgi:hypothetical protein